MLSVMGVIVGGRGSASVGPASRTSVGLSRRFGLAAAVLAMIVAMAVMIVIFRRARRLRNAVFEWIPNETRRDHRHRRIRRLRRCW